MTLPPLPPALSNFRGFQIQLLFLFSWIEVLAVAQFTRRGGHPLQPD